MEEGTNEVIHGVNSRESAVMKTLNTNRNETKDSEYINATPNNKNDLGENNNELYEPKEQSHTQNNIKQLSTMAKKKLHDNSYNNLSLPNGSKYTPIQHTFELPIEQSEQEQPVKKAEPLHQNNQIRLLPAVNHSVLQSPSPKSFIPSQTKEKLNKFKKSKKKKKKHQHAQRYQSFSRFRDNVSVFSRTSRVSRLTGRVFRGVD